MTYHRSYHKHQIAHHSEAAVEHVRQYRELSTRLGPIVEDIKQAFFNLLPADLENLLEIYARQYGTKAADYARRTLPLWRSGRTKISGQTAQRLLNLVPKYLSFEQRYVIVKKLCEHHAPKKYQHVTINVKAPAEGFAELRRTLIEFQDYSLLKHLPDHVLATATWLNDDDVTASRALIAQIDRQKAEIIQSITDRELRHLNTLIPGGTITSGSKTIEFPNGTISVVLHEPSACFVATVCFGNADAEPVFYLRQFRDRVLKPHPAGSKFVHWYYLHGPAL